MRLNKATLKINMNAFYEGNGPMGTIKNTTAPTVTNKWVPVRKWYAHTSDGKHVYFGEVYENHQYIGAMLHSTEETISQEEYFARRLSGEIAS